jgi:alanyl-tRNA synthetase
MTERLYYTDSYLRAFRAQVTDTAEDGRRVYLDRTAFYPASGGQPFDAGTLGGVEVREVVDEDDRVAHLLASPLEAVDVVGEIDWTRRYDHMQQHTGQHLLSAVLQDLFGWPTVGFHMGAASSTVDVRAAAVSSGQIQKAEERCARIAGEARPVEVTFEDSSSDLGLRKASERTGTLRILSIQGVDRSACGGTHVRSTAEIGAVLVRKIEKVRDTFRLEFVCGGRALERARHDYQLLSSIGRSLSSPLEDTPELVAGIIEKNKAVEKTAQKLAIELAQREGRELYQATAPASDGLRYVTQRGPIDDAMRTRAQAFAAGEKAVFLVECENPPSILLAVSADSGIHAGDCVKAAVNAAGGRGGGNKTLAQGSAPDLVKLLAALGL